MSESGPQVGPGVCVRVCFVRGECKAHLTCIHFKATFTSAYIAALAFEIMSHTKNTIEHNNTGTCGWVKEFPV